MADPNSELASQLQVDVPHAARIWNYWMGGKDNYAVDRAAGDAVAEMYPEIVFDGEAVPEVPYPGRGLPGRPRRACVSSSTSAPGCRRCRTPTRSPSGSRPGRTHRLCRQRPAGAGARPRPAGQHHRRGVGHLHATPTSTTRTKIVADASERAGLHKPVAVMFMGVLGYVADLDEVRSIVAGVMNAVPSGSYLVLWDGTDTSKAVVEGAEKLEETGGVPYILRSPEQLGQYFEGLEMVEPGPGADHAVAAGPRRVGDASRWTHTARWPASPDRPVVSSGRRGVTSRHPGSHSGRGSRAASHSAGMGLGPWWAAMVPPTIAAMVSISPRPRHRFVPPPRSRGGAWRSSRGRRGRCRGR